jgi:hypothetical protein
MLGAPLRRPGEHEHLDVISHRWQSRGSERAVDTIDLLLD